MNSNFTYALINEKTDKDTINFAFEIYKSNPEYFKLSSDKKVEIADLMNDIKAIPPNVNPNNKETSLYSFKESALAIMDILKFYPDEDTCYLGLLIINSSFQNKGFGKLIMNSLVDELISLGIDKIRLGVLKGNLKALEFWRKLDFSIINDSSIVTINGHISTVFILEKQLKRTYLLDKSLFFNLN